MQEFTINIGGRVKNFDLPKQQPLIPLFEAVVNSLYSIEERQEIEEFNGFINIEIVRDPQTVTDVEGIDKSINDIIGFNIIDNGIGFNDSNMKSFLQSDSTYRANKGGKGVGRFSWLKAFEKADVKSVYCEEGIYVRRRFEFSVDNNELDDSLIEINDVTDNCTIIKLINYKVMYQ